MTKPYTVARHIILAKPTVTDYVESIGRFDNVAAEPKAPARRRSGLRLG